MTGLLEVLDGVLIKNGLITAFAVVGATVWFSYVLSDRLTKGRLHGSAIAILIGLAAAYFGGLVTGGENGIKRRGPPASFRCWSASSRRLLSARSLPTRLATPTPSASRQSVPVRQPISSDR
jgi:hypothetical protein